MDSFWRNSKTVMIANIGPANYNDPRNYDNIRYTDRAKNIKKAPKDAMIRKNKEELNILKEGLVAASGGKINLDLFSGKIISLIYIFKN